MDRPVGLQDIVLLARIQQPDLYPAGGHVVIHIQERLDGIGNLQLPRRRV
jgi:hypothetical protein